SELRHPLRTGRDTGPVDDPSAVDQQPDDRRRGRERAQEPGAAIEAAATEEDGSPAHGVQEEQDEEHATRSARGGREGCEGCWPGDLGHGTPSGSSRRSPTSLPGTPDRPLYPAPAASLTPESP